MRLLQYETCNLPKHKIKQREHNPNNMRKFTFVNIQAKDLRETQEWDNR